MKYLKKFENHTAYEEARQNLILPNVSLCEQENEVHYNPYVDPYNGHAYVDLGLPSGTKWATMNVGANNIMDYGLYFAWGETLGYADASTKAFSWADYELGDGGSSASNMTKYNSTDGLTTLEAVDDAATVNMGGSWHMPTNEQYEELLNSSYVRRVWITDYQGSGVNGSLFTSVKNGNTLFIPAAGYAGYSEMNSVSNGGYIWSSSSIIGSMVTYAYYLSFGSDYFRTSNYPRNYGLSVRGVVG